METTEQMEQQNELTDTLLDDIDYDTEELEEILDGNIKNNSDNTIENIEEDFELADGDEDNNNSDTVSSNNKNTKQKNKDTKLTSRELYERILAHPDMRVCEYTGSNDSMRPLEFQGVTPKGTLVFEYDYASTAFHPHGLCEDIIDLVGDTLDAVGDGYVICDDWIDKDGNKLLNYRKATISANSGWILLHR